MSTYLSLIFAAVLWVRSLKPEEFVVTSMVESEEKLACLIKSTTRHQQIFYPLIWPNGTNLSGLTELRILCCNQTINAGQAKENWELCGHANKFSLTKWRFIDHIVFLPHQSDLIFIFKNGNKNFQITKLFKILKKITPLGKKNTILKNFFIVGQKNIFVFRLSKFFF